MKKALFASAILFASIQAHAQEMDSAYSFSSQLGGLRLNLSIPESAKDSGIYVLQNDSHSSCYVQTSPGTSAQEGTPNPPMRKLLGSDGSFAYDVALASEDERDPYTITVSFTHKKNDFKGPHAEVFCQGKFTSPQDVIRALVKSPNVKLSWAGAPKEYKNMSYLELAGAHAKLLASVGGACEASLYGGVLAEGFMKGFSISEWPFGITTDVALSNPVCAQEAGDLVRVEAEMQKRQDNTVATIKDRFSDFASKFQHVEYDTPPVPVNPATAGSGS